MKSKDTVGGWMWYVRQVVDNLNRGLVSEDYKELMKKYMAGTPWQKTVEEMNK